MTCPVSMLHIKLINFKWFKNTNMKCTSFEHEVSKERIANLKDLFRVENLDPIAVAVVVDEDDASLEPIATLFSIL